MKIKSAIFLQSLKILIFTSLCLFFLLFIYIKNESEKKYDEYKKSKIEMFTIHKNIKIEIGRTLIRALRSNKELNIYLKDGSMLENVSKKREIGEDVYYRYIKSPINRVKITKIINEIMGGYNNVSLQIYNIKREKLMSLGELPAKNDILKMVDFNIDFGELCYPIIYNDEFYMQYYALDTTREYLFVFGIKLTHDDIYEIWKNGIKIFVAEENNENIIFSSYFGDTIPKNMYEIKNYKDPKYSILKVEEIISEDNKKYILYVSIEDNRKTDSEIIITIIKILILFDLLFLVLIYFILGKFVTKELKIIKILIDKDITDKFESGIEEINEIKEKIDKTKIENNSCNISIMEELRRKNSEVENLSEEILKENKFLKTITTERKIEEILKKSYYAINEITPTIEIKVSTLVKGQEKIKVLKINDCGDLVEEVEENSGISEFLLEGKKIKVKGNGKTLICYMFKSETISAGIISFVYRESLEYETKEKFIDSMVEIMILSIRGAKFYEMSIKDGATGIYNRSAFEFYAEDIMKKDENKKYSFLLFDINNIIEINEKYGIVAGDLVIKECAEFISKNLGEFEKIFRYSGKEFIIVFNEMEKEKIYDECEKLIEIIEKNEFKIGVFSNETVKLKFSIGIVQYSILRHKKINDILKDLRDRIATARNKGDNKMVM